MSETATIIGPGQSILDHVLATHAKITSLLNWIDRDKNILPNQLRDHWPSINSSQYVAAFDDFRRIALEIEERPLLESMLDAQVILPALEILDHSVLLYRQVLEFYIPSYESDLNLGIDYEEGSEEDMGSERIYTAWRAESSCLQVVEYEVGLIMKEVAKIQKYINGEDKVEETEEERSVAIVWAGSMHDSDRSTMHMDNSSSIWRPDMDEYWAREWGESEVL